MRVKSLFVSCVFVIAFGVASGWTLHAAAEESTAEDGPGEGMAPLFGGEAAAFLVVTNGVAEAANIRGQSIVALCELTRRVALKTGDPSFQRVLDRCTVMAVQHERFVHDLTGVIDHVAALDALTNAPEVNVTPLPPQTFLGRWQRERQTILAGLRRLLAREGEITSKNALIEIMSQRRYGIRRANAALARIGHPKRIAEIREILERVEWAVHALESVPPLPNVGPGAPAPPPPTPPARPLPRGESVPT